MIARPVHASEAQRAAARRRLAEIGWPEERLPRAIRLPVQVEEQHAALLVRRDQLQREEAR